MRDKEIVGLYQAYLDVYSNSNEEVEQLDEDFPKQVDTFFRSGGDRLRKIVPRVSAALTTGKGGTVTAAQQNAQIKPVGEEVEQLDELSSEVMARAKHKRMQNLDAAQRREMDARNVGATMGEISKRSEETSDATAKFSKHNQLSSRHARSRKRMNKEEVENWVNSLIEEGYDLSEYTWDDMYEMYVTEADSIAAMRERSAKRRKQRYGASDTSRGGRDDFAPITDYEAANKKWARPTQKEEVDLFDAILEHLVAEGYADTNESALAIMANMSDEWRESIVEASVDYDMTSDEMEKARNERKFGKQSFNQAGQTKLRRQLHKSQRGVTKKDARRWEGEK